MALTPVLFSVSYSGSWGQAKLSVEEFIDKAAALGFAGVMLGGKRPHLSPLDYDADARKRLRERIGERGLNHVIVAAYNNVRSSSSGFQIMRKSWCGETSGRSSPCSQITPPSQSTS